MLDSKAIGKGQDNLQFTLNDLNTEILIDSLSIKPANIHLDHSATILEGINDIFSIQLVNLQGSPIFATQDVPIQLVVKDESLLQIPNTVTIKKGDYFTLFDAAPKNSGITEISALSEGLPLSTSTIEIKDLTPKIEIEIPTIVEAGDSFVASISVKKDDIPIKDLTVTWKIDGGAVQISDKKTGPTGNAAASIISLSNEKIKVEAVVSGSIYTPSTITKTVLINSTSEFVAFADDGLGRQNIEKFEIAGIDPVIILVPAAIGLVGYMLRKQGSFKIRNQPTQVQTA